MNDLIPRLPKRKRQPTAQTMRTQLAMAADEIIRLRAILSRPWWRRLFRRGNT